MKQVISDVMDRSGVRFGTSGARGLAVEMTDRVCYIYARGFLQYLEQVGELKKQGEPVALAGDLRPSTGRIMEAVARAASDMGYAPVNCGRVPSPAVGLFGLDHNCPAIMVTGSHIPADRNGIKFNKCSGEILKTDEPGIVAQAVELPETLFSGDGSFVEQKAVLPDEDPRAAAAYVARYRSVFPPDCLAGKKIGLYQHSAVGRDLLQDLFASLGAEVVPLGRSDTFVPVDTEAIREEDSALALEWAQEHALDAVVSTDGDSDRPLISDEQGRWLRGDLACILVARFLGAGSVSTPVSCNSAVELTGWFDEVRRTKIGSPFVVASMIEATADGRAGVVGYEANGGFLTNSSFELFGNALEALPTRDAVLPVLSVLLLSIREGTAITGLLEQLPQRYTASGLIRDFPTEESRAIIDRFTQGETALDIKAIEAVFGEAFGPVKTLDRTDGLRITFESGEILHVRPSGNAPEFRCYNEASSGDRVAEMNRQSMAILQALRAGAG